MPKVPCVSCGNEVLDTTASRTGGYCMPCAKRIPADQRQIDPAFLPRNWSKRDFDVRNRNGFVRLCQVTVPSDDELTKDVLEAIDDPDAFVSRVRDLLGMDKYWLPMNAFLEGLRKRSMLVSVDHRCSPEDLEWAIRSVLSAQTTEKILPKLFWDDDEDPEYVLREIGANLRRHNYVLATFFLGDSYDLVAFPKDRFDDIYSTLAKLDYFSVETWD